MKAKYLEGRHSLLRIANPPLGSAIWKGILDVKDVIITNSRWEIQNGEEVYFWDDTWLREKLLIQYEEFQECFAWAKRRQGLMVKDYLLQDHGRLIWNFRSSNISDIHDKMKILRDEVQVRQWRLNLDSRDVISWKHNKSGQYTIKDGFEIVNKDDMAGNDGIWRRVWMPGILPKITFFTWSAMHGKILTLDNLQKKGFSLANKCIMCGKENETVDHLLPHCHIVGFIWYSMAERFSLYWVFPRTVREAMVQWRIMGGSKNEKKLMNFAAQHILWGLWNERNKRVFEDVTVSKEMLLKKILARLRENFVSWHNSKEECRIVEVAEHNLPEEHLE